MRSLPTPEPSFRLSGAGRASTELVPDIVLLVQEERRTEGVFLSYQLELLSARFGEPIRDEKIRSESLTGDPSVYLGSLTHWIADLDHRRGEPRQIEDEVAGIGVRLFEQLLPERLRERLWTLQGGSPAPTLQVITAVSWVPWELMKLRKPHGGAGSDGPFLAEAFALTRWVEGQPQALTLPLRRLALIAPREPALPGVAAESRSLRDLGLEIIDIQARYLPVIDAFSSGELDGWHFIGHGLDRGDNPDAWSLHLEAGEQLTPMSLSDRARGLGTTRPWVFLNACHSGRSARSLTGVGGFGEAFLRAGAGAFLGTSWAVEDDQARIFALLIYQEFLDGRPLAEAVRRARSCFRATYPGDPTWLAYVVYGHPLATRTPPPAVEGDAAKHQMPVTGSDQFAQETVQSMVDRSRDRISDRVIPSVRPELNRALSFAFGVVFLIILVVLAWGNPDPQAFLYKTLHIILSLAAAGIAATIPGFFDLEIRGWLRVGAAVVVFGLTYFFNPPPPEGKAFKIDNISIDSTTPEAKEWVVDTDPLRVSWTHEGKAEMLEVRLENVQTARQTKPVRVSAGEGAIVFNVEDYREILAARERGAHNRIRALIQAGRDTFESREVDLRVGITVALFDLGTGELMVTALIDGSSEPLGFYQFQVEVVGWYKDREQGLFTTDIFDVTPPYQGLTLGVYKQLDSRTLKLVYHGPDDDRLVRYQENPSPRKEKPSSSGS